MKLTKQVPLITKQNDTNLEAWIVEASGKGELIRTVLVNDTTGEAMEIRAINPLFLASAFKTAIMVEMVEV